MFLGIRLATYCVRWYCERGGLTVPKSKYYKRLKAATHIPPKWSKKEIDKFKESLEWAQTYIKEGGFE